MADITEEENEGDETVILTRRDRRRPGAGSEAAADQTESAADEATVVVDRSGRPEAGSAEEATVVVSRPARRSRRKGNRSSGGADRVSTAAAEPVAPASFSTFAEPTPALYKPRPAPLTPSTPPAVVGAAAPSRIADPDQPSVAKQARRWSLLALSAFAGACAVSVAGLVGIGFLVFG